MVFGSCDAMRRPELREIQRPEERGDTFRRGRRRLWRRGTKTQEEEWKATVVPIARPSPRAPPLAPPPCARPRARSRATPPRATHLRHARVKSSAHRWCGGGVWEGTAAGTGDRASELGRRWGSTIHDGLYLLEKPRGLDFHGQHIHFLVDGDAACLAADEEHREQRVCVEVHHIRAERNAFPVLLKKSGRERGVQFAEQ